MPFFALCLLCQEIAIIVLSGWGERSVQVTVAHAEESLRRMNQAVPQLSCFKHTHTHLYLDNKGLVLEAWTHPQLTHVGHFIDEVLDAVENATARGRDSTVDSSLADGFSSHAGVSIDVLGSPRSKFKINM